MKSFGFLLCSMFFTALLFTSCNKGITVKGENGKEYKTYQAACRDNDYNAAHEFLDLMQQKANEPVEKNWLGKWNSDEVKANKKAYQDAVDYVYTQEIMFLVSDGSESAANRIIYLMTEARSEYTNAETTNEMIKQEDFLNKLCGKVVDLAISQGNIELIMKLVPQCYSYKETTVSEGLKDYFYIHENLDKERCERYLYVKERGLYNALCNKLFDYALNKSDKNLAQEVLQLYKQNIIVTKGDSPAITVNGVKVDGNHSYVNLTYQDKEVAQNRFKEAVANGTFQK